MKRVLVPLVVLGCLSICAQDDGRIAYQARQAAQEVQRLSSQFDQLESRVEAISSRMNGMESSNSTRDIRAEIGAIRSELNELKRRQAAMRGEIVAELSKKMADLIAKSAPPPPPPSRPSSSSRAERPQRGAAAPRDREPAPTGPAGPYFEHIVEPGETLSYIAKECKTTIQKIKQYSGLKSDNLRVGQKLLIPAEDEKNK
ncbi:MAG: LysM peptidoglycan-binding domain-containing protein [Kiritimatiellia bacterium]|nr:LysM peptidoglycan-binding domain-containing protein [Kiritimatiellia bacterium]